MLVIMFCRSCARGPCTLHPKPGITSANVGMVTVRESAPENLKRSTNSQMFQSLLPLSVGDHDEYVRALALEGISSVLRRGDNDAGSAIHVL